MKKLISILIIMSCTTEPIVEGCTADTACNYDATATKDDSSCIYAENDYNCDGNCLIEEDCVGACGGDAVEDECGVCDADTSNDNTTCEQDCAGVWGGNATQEYCGSCVSEYFDCAGVCNGDAVECSDGSCDAGGNYPGAYPGSSCPLDRDTMCWNHHQCPDGWYCDGYYDCWDSNLSISGKADCPTNPPCNLTWGDGAQYCGGTNGGGPDDNSGREYDCNTPSQHYWCGCAPCGIETLGHIWPCGTDCNASHEWSGVWDVPNDKCDDACLEQNENDPWGGCPEGTGAEWCTEQCGGDCMGCVED